MISYERIKDAQDTIIEYWGSDGARVIEECARVNPFNASGKTFLECCIPCGGNWGGMFLSGIKALFPSVYDAIPDDMGHMSFFCICSTALLCGVDFDRD